MESSNRFLRLSDSSTNSNSTVKTGSSAPTEFSVASLPVAAELEAKPFANLRRLYHEIRSTDEETLIYKGITEDIFTKIERWRDRSGRRIRLFYLADLQTLIITIPNAAHEHQHLGFYNEFRSALWEMGLHRDWDDKGACTYKFGGSGAQGDSTGGPLGMRGKGSDWPTLVVESGPSQSWVSLRIKMHWWFGASGDQVKIVVLSKFDVSRRIIEVEKWIEVETRRSGATTTRHLARSSKGPRCMQTITITLPEGSQNQASQFVIQGAPLVLDFELLFLRPPNADETDIQIREQAFRRWAVRVWYLQEE